MISDLLKTDDPVAQRDLERIDRLLLSDVFLKGLGVKASEVPPPDDFPLVEDIVVADSMIRLQDIWDTPEPWPYQYFPGVVDGEMHRIRHDPDIDRNRSDEIHAALTKMDKKYVRYYVDRIELSYNKNDIFRFIMDNNKNHSRKDSYIEHIIKAVLEYNIQAYLAFFVETAFLGGLDRSPIFKRMLEAFETGGVPCGWFGPLPEDGGEPVKAIALLHFGRAGGTRS